MWLGLVHRALTLFLFGESHAHLLSLRPRQWTSHPNSNLRQQRQRRDQSVEGHVRQR
jgi:hypothetical protein